VRKKVQEKLAELRKVAMVEVVDPDLKKFADEAQKQRKAIEEQQQGGTVGAATDAPATEAPADGGGDGTSGKGDLLVPQQ
jgi:hypothetical protein